MTVHFLADPYADHPVVNRNICYGGGNGSSTQAPDYSAYISKMTALGEEGMGWARDLVGWAKSTGVDLMQIAKDVGAKAGAAGDTQQATSDRLMKEWESTYGPLYKAQAADAERMIKDLPGTEEHYAGKFGADTAQAMDQARNTQLRNMRAQGFAPSAVASGAIDTMAGLQRAAAVTAASEGGRYAARSEARDVTGKALKAGEGVAGVSSDQAKVAGVNRAMETGAPNDAARTTASLYGPAAGFYATATPYFKEWGNATNMGFQNQMAAEEDEDSTMADIMGGVGAVGGTIAGAYFGGPAGAMAGGKAGSALGSGTGSLFSAKGGKIPPMGRRVPRSYAQGGAIDTGEDNYVDPSMSPSGGEQVDDVQAMVSAGEFVIPERTVDWFGEKYFQNLIMKSDKDRETQTVAAPEEGPMPEDQPQQGFAAEAPMFRSEGARV